MNIDEALKILQFANLVFGRRCGKNAYTAALGTVISIIKSVKEIYEEFERSGGGIDEIDCWYDVCEIIRGHNGKNTN